MASLRAHLGVCATAAAMSGLLGAALACSGETASAPPPAAPNASLEQRAAQLDGMSAHVQELQAKMAECRGDSDCLARLMPEIQRIQAEAARATFKAMRQAAAEETPGCSRDADCKGARVCNGGRCVEPGAAPAAPAAARAAFLRGQPQPGTFALIVGIEHYRDVPAAAGAKRDAERFADLARSTLGVKDGNLRTAIDDRATLGDIRKQLDWLKSNVPANGRVLFFYSGHGAPDASQGTPYLLPYDGDAKSVDKTAISLADVLKALGETRAREVLAVVDSCFSGAGGRSVLPDGARPLVKVKETAPVARLSLFSGASGAEISGPAESGDGGLFSEYVAEGIGTAAADIDGDGTVTLKELSDWVTPRVAREAKRMSRDQTPSLAVGSGSNAADFALAYGVAK